MISLQLSFVFFFLHSGIEFMNDISNIYIERERKTRKDAHITIQFNSLHFILLTMTVL